MPAIRTGDPAGSIVFYVSGHGFGHAARTIEVINALGRRRPDVAIAVRTSAARWLFDLTAQVPVRFHSMVCDAGAAQTDSLHLDAETTIREAARFQDRLPALAREEARALDSLGAKVVVADIPPLGFAAASLFGIPSVGLGNFTWDWIYEAYPEAGAIAPDLGRRIRDDYARASLALRLPMHGGFEGWRCEIVDIPFVARHSRVPRAEVRERLGIEAGRRMVLASFGGLGIANLDFGALDGLSGYHVVTTGHALGRQPRPRDGVTVLRDRDLYGMGLHYEDLVHASEVVVTKPGYGIIAECIANDTAVVYTSRGRFIEYDVLVAEMPRYLRCEFMSPEELFAGAWRGALDRVLARTPPPERPSTSGAEVAAEAILRVAGLAS